MIKNLSNSKFEYWMRTSFSRYKLQGITCKGNDTEEIIQVESKLQNMQYGAYMHEIQTLVKSKI